MRYCPTCKKFVYPIETDAYLVCPHCGTVLEEILVASPELYKDEMLTVLSSHHPMPVYGEKTFKKRARNVGIEFKRAEEIYHTSVIQQCIKNTLSKVKYKGERLDKHWIKDYVLLLLSEPKERRERLFEELKEKIGKRIDIVRIAYSIVCKKCGC